MSEENESDSSKLRSGGWIHDWSRNYGVLYCEVIMDEMEKCPFSSFPPDSHILFPDNKNVGHFVRADKWEKHVVDINDIISNEESLDKEIKNCEKAGFEYVGTAQRISKMDLKNLGNLELLQLFEEYRTEWIRYTSYVWSLFHINELLNPETEKFLDEKAKEFDSNEEFEKFIEYVTSPIKKSSILKLNEELFEVKKNHCEEKLQEICERYIWVPCLDLHHPPWTVADLRGYYNSHVFSDKPLPDESVLDSQKLTEKERRLIRISRKMAYAKDVRDEYRRRGVYHSRKLFGEIGKRMGLSPNQISYALSDEIREFLTHGKNPDIKTILERASAFMMLKRNGELTCASGKDIEKYATELDFKKTESMGKEVKGTIGSKGKATGRVKIVLVEDDLSKISDGDVIVALTTNPAYTPAMSKAVAFVTDQGGITCHAAIVAREMKKPCIVGTKNATKILKDGDLIEVDADSGTVRKLEE